jgi:hypothetical protein
MKKCRKVLGQRERLAEKVRSEQRKQDSIKKKRLENENMTKTRKIRLDQKRDSRKGFQSGTRKHESVK